MKNFFFWVVLLGLSIFPTRAAIKAQSAAEYYDPSYQLENGYYQSLGFGSPASHFKFMSNQVASILIYYYQQNGTGGSSVPDIEAYAFDPTTETLGEGMKRAANTEFNRVKGVMGWSAEQKFSIAIFLYNSTTKLQFTAPVTTFTPSMNGSTFDVPDAVSLNAKLIPVGIGPQSNDRYSIAWPGIRRASLVVRDLHGKLLYSGDSLNNRPNDTNLWVASGAAIYLPHKWCIDSSITSTLNIYMVNDETGEELSVSYSDGNWVSPYGLKPLVIMDRSKPGRIFISGGSPNTAVGIKTYHDLSQPPVASCQVTLGNVGSATWTSLDNTSSMQFFVLDHYIEASPASKK